MRNSPLARVAAAAKRHTIDAIAKGGTLPRHRATSAPSARPVRIGSASAMLDLRRRRLHPGAAAGCAATGLVLGTDDGCALRDEGLRGAWLIEGPRGGSGPGIDRAGSGLDRHRRAVVGCEAS